MTTINVKITVNAENRVTGVYKEDHNEGFAYSLPANHGIFYPQTLSDWQIQNGLIKFSPLMPSTETIVPNSVSRAQLKLALLTFNLFNDVDAFIMNGSDLALKINWTERSTFERNHPLVTTIAAHFNKTEKEIDDIFINAASQ